MNYADFVTQPDGFPLESDATLGFMQSSYQGAIRALASAAGDDAVIVSGLEIVGGIASDGWIFKDGELVFFQGGAVSANYLIETTVTQKANQNGTLVDRYFVKKARFGSGPGSYVFGQLQRLNTREDQLLANWGVGSVGIQGESWVILNGLSPSGSGVSSGFALYAGLLVSAPSYSDTVVTESTPLYLYPDGTWSLTFNATALRFDPYTTRRMEDIVRRRAAVTGSIHWIASSEVPAVFFPGTGLGKWAWQGWALANGNNGTLDLSTAITGLTAIQRI